MRLHLPGSSMAGSTPWMAYFLPDEGGVHQTRGWFLLLVRCVGVPPDRQGLRAEDVPEAARLYKDGWSLARLGAKYGCQMRPSGRIC